ncbi:unnamed protein product, partial [marine sediment metagenome]
TILRWELGKSHSRRKDFREDIVWSSAVYDICVGQLIHVPTQMKLTNALPNRKKAALRYGDWALRMLDPKTVYIEWSDFMPERILQVNVKAAREIIEFWGDKAKPIKAEIDKHPKKDREKLLAELWVEFDLVDHENGRVVWASQGNKADTSQSGEKLFGPEPWLKVVENGKQTKEQVPFLPIIVAAGGTTVDYDPAHQLKPLLYPVYMTEQWAVTNIAATIMMSQQIAAGSSAADVYSGVGAEDIEEDWEGPRR